MLPSIGSCKISGPDWFPTSERSLEQDGQLDPSWLVPDEGPLKLEIVEYLRQAHNISARIKDFSSDDFQCVVAFAGPGYSADAFIDSSTGKYQIRQVTLGVVPIINDLLWLKRRMRNAFLVALTGTIALGFLATTFAEGKLVSTQTETFG